MTAILATALILVAADLALWIPSEPGSRPITIAVVIHATCLAIVHASTHHLVIIHRMRTAMTHHRWRTYRIRSLQYRRAYTTGMALEGADGSMYFVEYEVNRREPEQRHLGGRAVWVAGDLATHAVITAPGGGDLHYTSLTQAWTIPPVRRRHTRQRADEGPGA